MNTGISLLASRAIGDSSSGDCRSHSGTSKSQLPAEFRRRIVGKTTGKAEDAVTVLATGYDRLTIFPARLNIAY